MLKCKGWKEEKLQQTEMWGDVREEKEDQDIMFLALFFHLEVKAGGATLDAEKIPSCIGSSLRSFLTKEETKRSSGHKDIPSPLAAQKSNPRTLTWFRT